MVSAVTVSDFLTIYGLVSLLNILHCLNQFEPKGMKSIPLLFCLMSDDCNYKYCHR